jgi:hypothetical protein
MTSPGLIRKVRPKQAPDTPLLRKRDASTTRMGKLIKSNYLHGAVKKRTRGRVG